MHGCAVRNACTRQSNITSFGGIRSNNDYCLLAVLADNQHVASLWWVIVLPARVLILKGIAVPDISVNSWYRIRTQQVLYNGVAVSHDSSSTQASSSTGMEIFRAHASLVRHVF